MLTIYKKKNLYSIKLTSNNSKIIELKNVLSFTTSNGNWTSLFKIMAFMEKMSSFTQNFFNDSKSWIQ